MRKKVNKLCKRTKKVTITTNTVIIQNGIKLWDLFDVYLCTKACD